MLQPSLMHQVVDDGLFKVAQFADPIPLLLLRTKTAAGDPVKRKMRIMQGGIYLLRIAVMNVYGVPYNMADWFVRGKIKASSDPDAAIIKSFGEGTGLTKVFVSNDLVTGRNYFDIYINSDVTDDLDFDTAVFDLEMVLQTGTPILPAVNMTFDVYDSSSGHGSITNASGTFFAGIADGTLCRVTAVGTAADDYLWEDTYETLGASSNTKLTFTDKLGYGRLLSSTSNKVVTTASVTPIVLDETNVIRLLSGLATLQRNALV